MTKLRDLTLEQLVQIADEHFVDNLASGNLEDAYADNVARHVVFAMQRERGAAFLGLTYIPRGSFLPPLRRWEGEQYTNPKPSVRREIEGYVRGIPVRVVVAREATGVFKVVTAMWVRTAC